MVCCTVTHILMCVLFHSLLRGDFPTRRLQPLHCPLVSLQGVPDRVEDSLLQNWCRSCTSQCTGTLAVVTDMHRRTELSFVDEFRWVSPLHCLKQTDDITLFFFGACCKRGRHLYTTTAPSCFIPASYCHLSATLQTTSIIVVNLQENRVCS